MSVLLIGCENEKALNFEPQFNATSVDCFKSLHQQPLWKLDQFWFYVSDLQVKNEGRWQPLMMKNTRWQQHNVALVGLHCNESKDQNWAINIGNGNLLTGNVTIKFNIAVPFSTNHQNPLKAQGIFDNANMFWTWQQGYKSLRFDIASSEGNAWAFHVGATGCHSPSVLRSPSKPCREANVIEIVVTDFNIDKPLIIELASILNTIEPSHENRCLSMPTQSICQLLMSNMRDLTHPVFYQSGEVDE